MHSVKCIKHLSCGLPPFVCDASFVVLHCWVTALDAVCMPHDDESPEEQSGGFSRSAIRAWDCKLSMLSCTLPQLAACNFCQQ